MPRISNKSAYENQETVNQTDYLIGTDANTLATKTFEVGALVAAVFESTTIEVTLSNASTYQNDKLLDSSEEKIFAYISGQEISTGGLITGYNSDTGTITFAVAVSGKIKILILP